MTYPPRVVSSRFRSFQVAAGLCQAAGIQVTIGHVLTIEDEDVILRVHADTAQPSEHPLVGKRFRPARIDGVADCALREQTRSHRNDRRQCGHRGRDESFEHGRCPSGRMLARGRGAWRPAPPVRRRYDGR